MHYEKAELLLRQLMAGDEDLYLVRDAKDGKAVITDRPTEKQGVVGKLRGRVKVVRVLIVLILCTICPITISQRIKIVQTSAVFRDDDESVTLEECKC